MSLQSRAFMAGWGAVRHMPESLGRSLFGATAGLAAHRGGPGTRRLRENLRVLTGLDGAPLDALTEQGLRSYARYWFEAFRLPAMDPTDVAARQQMPAARHIHEAMDRGRGAILVLSHSGNWDAAGVWLVEQGIPFTTVAERLQPAELYDAFVAYREGLGMEVVPATGGERPPIEVLEERLRAGKCLCLLSDRDMTPTGVPVRFATGTATLPAGPAVLALRTGAPIVPVGLSFRDDRRWFGDIRPPLAIPEGDEGDEGDDGATRVAIVTQRMADVLGEFVSAHPQDWHMLQRFWRDDPDPARADRPAPP